MKIKEIQLRGFRSHYSTKIDGLGRFVCFLGPNGAGKSTILDAIGYALTGVCRGLDDRGSGADYLVTRPSLVDETTHPATKSFAINITTTKGSIVRGLGEGPKAKVQSEIGRKFGIDPVLARTLVQTASFTRLPQATQKQVVLSVAGSQVSADEILALLGQSAGYFDATSAPLDSLEAIDRADKEMRAVRPDLKRQISELVVPEVDEALGDPSRGISEAETALREFRGERDQIVKAKATYDATAANLKERKKELERILNTGLKSKDLGDPAKIEAEINKLTEAEETRDKEYQALRSEVDVLVGRMEATRQNWAIFAKLKGSCPTCQRAIGKSDVDAVTKTIKDHGAKIAGELKPKQKHLEELAYDQERGKRLLELKGKLEEIRQHANTEKRLKDQQAEARKVLKEIEAFFAKPVPAADTSEIDSEIAKGEAFIGAQRAVSAALQTRRQALQQKTALETRLSNCEELIEKLGPKGPVRAKLMEGGGDEFIADVNVYAKALRLGTVSVVTSPGFAIEVGGSPAALLSASEDYRLNLAFAAALAKRSGTGILILDGAEILDGDNREAVNDVLEKAGLEQAFIAATPETMPEVVGNDGNWSIFAVTKANGLSRVERYGAAVPA